MEITRTLERFAWHIEPKPEGGFIARCSDPSVPPLEADNRIELQRKVRENITAHLATQFPSLKISLDKEDIKLPLFDADDLAASKPGEASAQSGEGGIKGAVEQWLTKNAVAAIGSQLPPELMEKLKTQAHDGKLSFTVTTTTKGSGNTQVRTKTISFGDAKLPLQLGSQPQQNSASLPPSAPVSASFSNQQLDTATPITPVSSSTWFLKFVLAAIVVLGLIFLLTHFKK
ncbi:MAG TPA: hypothetical protein VJO35_04990 [Terriglobales bacterium]|nr:hypothetical protein [Terriglobales bacterium]